MNFSFLLVVAAMASLGMFAEACFFGNNISPATTTPANCSACPPLPRDFGQYLTCILKNRTTQTCSINQPAGTTAVASCAGFDYISYSTSTMASQSTLSPAVLASIMNPYNVINGVNESAVIACVCVNGTGMWNGRLSTACKPTGSPTNYQPTPAEIVTYLKNNLNWAATYVSFTSALTTESMVNFTIPGVPKPSNGTWSNVTPLKPLSTPLDPFIAAINSTYTVSAPQSTFSYQAFQRVYARLFAYNNQASFNIAANPSGLNNVVTIDGVAYNLQTDYDLNRALQSVARSGQFPGLVVNY